MHLVSFISISLKSLDTIFQRPVAVRLQRLEASFDRLESGRRDARLRGHDRSGGILMKRLAFVVALSVAGGTAALAADIQPPLAPPPLAPAAYIPFAPVYPYNWPASISAAISALALLTLAAQQTRLAARLGPLPTPRFWAAAKLASITNSGASSSSARRPCSIGFPIPKTPST
jgi:hypothetical protein